MNDAIKSIFKRETALPGMSLLFSPDVLIEQLSRDEQFPVPDAITPDYIRYKPGANCLVRYRVRYGDEIRLAHAKVFSHDARSRFEKAHMRHENSDLADPLIFLNESAQLLFSFFPADAKVHSMVKLFDHKPGQSVLGRVFKDEHHWHTYTLDVLNYKPERRLVARVENEHGRKCVLKMYSAKGFQRIRHTRKHLIQPHSLSIPQWEGGSKSHRALALNWIEGTNLRELDDAANGGKHELAGRVLAKFHSSEQPRLKKLSSREQKYRLLEIAQHLGWLLPELEEKAWSMANHLGRWLRSQPKGQLPLHGDFYDKQVLFDGHDAALIDCDGAHKGHAEADLGCYLAHLIRHGSNSFEADREALLDGYRQKLPDFMENNLDIYTSISLFRLLHNPFRDCEPDWPTRTQTLLAKCAHLTEGTA